MISSPTDTENKPSSRKNTSAEWCWETGFLPSAGRYILQSALEVPQQCLKIGMECGKKPNLCLENSTNQEIKAGVTPAGARALRVPTRCEGGVVDADGHEGATQPSSVT